jgi:hypothetical protein
MKKKKKKVKDPKLLKTTANGWFGAGVKEATVEATERTVTIRPTGLGAFSLPWDTVAEIVVWRVSKNMAAKEMKG